MDARLYNHQLFFCRAKASPLPTPIPNGNEVTSLEAVKLADLNVPISSIKPSPAIPPLTLQESDDGTY